MCGTDTANTLLPTTPPEPPNDPSKKTNIIEFVSSQPKASFRTPDMLTFEGAATSCPPVLNRERTNGMA
jgi:hypothetical protein